MKIYPKIEGTTPLFCDAKVIVMIAILQTKNKL
jgi:hypothetical protein